MLLDSYEDAGVLVAVELANTLASPGVPLPARDRMVPLLRQVFAVDPLTVAQVKASDAPGFVALARALRPVFEDVHGRDEDAAAARLNDLLARHPAHPHLAKEGGRWRLHHHPRDVALVPMWTSICAEALARMLGAAHAGRFGVCEAGCGRVFFDVSKNASRRFCSTTCQNRVKAAAFRLRRDRKTRRAARGKPAR